MEDKKQFKKNFIWNILGTGFNAFNSLFFMITVTRLNGLNNAGIFTIAFSTACIIYVIGIYAGRIYQVTEQNKNILNKDYIINRLITVVLMSVIVILFSLIRRYDKYKALVFFLLILYKSIEAFSEVIYGILQKNERLEFVGKSLFIKAIVSVVTFISVDIITKNMIFSIISIIITWLLVLFIYDFNKSKPYINWKEKYKKENILNIFKNGFTTFAIAFLSLYIINAPKYSIDSYLPNDIQTIYGIIVMPATVIGLVAQFLIHPFLNQILKYFESKNINGLKKIILKLIVAITVFGMIASILAYFLGTQVLGIVYGLDLHLYKVGLFIIIIASTLYTIGIIYSSVLTTVRETFSQFVIYVIISIYALIVSSLLTKKWGLDGAIISYFVIMLLQFLLYTIYTNMKLEIIFKRKK